MLRAGGPQKRGGEPGAGGLGGNEPAELLLPQTEEVAKALVHGEQKGRERIDGDILFDLPTFGVEAGVIPAGGRGKI